ncbi:type VII secretion protein EccE [Streptomyces sp. B6B3]|uniref:type VII secretion protein EccE n=1 Tax=Streptomyces sp. B6B3 TaxID=3153570 RepID=UPI00325E7E91
MSVRNVWRRFRGLRFGRARLVAIETGLAAVAVGLALRGPWGYYVLAGAGLLLVVGALVRRRGAWADQRVLARLRGRRLAVPPPPGPHGREPGELGLVRALLPALDVTEVADRNSEPEALGVVSDGRGHAAVVAFPGGMLPALPADQVARWLAEDPARPAAAQLVVEQFGVPPWDFHFGFQPATAYRQLPYRRRPVAVRSWLVVRYEPLPAPEAAARRGGGHAGACAAVAAATARLRARLAAHGVPTTPLGADEVTDLLRQLGDPEAEGRALPTSWAGQASTHCTLTARVSCQNDWQLLLSGLAACAADRLVAAATLTAHGGTLRVLAAVRLVSTLAQHAAGERERLLAAGVTGPPAADQTAGLLATLPLAYPTHPLDEATGFAGPVPVSVPVEATAR